MSMTDTDGQPFCAGAPAPQAWKIRLGALTAVCDAFSLRWISVGNVELLRGVGFVVRDEQWNTARFDNLNIASLPLNDGLGFTITGRAHLPPGALDCTLEVTVTTRRIMLSGTATAVGTVKTNRTGFTILYPETAAGKDVQVIHGDGMHTNRRLPDLISPHQPFFDIRELHYRPTPSINVRLRLEGDSFEMEDQRNWSDASFKVYSRALAAPFPYTIDDGQIVRQSVAVTLEGVDGAVASPDARAPVEITIGPGVTGPLPSLGLGGRAEDWHLSAVEQDALSRLRPSVVMAEIDLSLAIPDLSGISETASRLGLRPTLLARMPNVGGSAALEVLATKAPQLAALALGGANEMELNTARGLFPGVRLGVGTSAFFAEFNRVPPPKGGDFVFWTVNPTVHAEDDASVMETLRTLPLQSATARHHLPGQPLWCGPITFRRRGEFSGANTRFPQADARLRAPFGAAFTLGQICRWAEAGMEALVFYQPCGPLGVIPRATDAMSDEMWPVYQLLEALSGGACVQHVVNTSPCRLVALAVDGNLWLANLTPDQLTAKIHLAGNSDLEMRLDSQNDFGQTSNLEEQQRERSCSERQKFMPVEIEAYGALRVSYDLTQ